MRLWATANYCRAGIKSLRGTVLILEKLLFVQEWYTGFKKDCPGGQLSKKSFIAMYSQVVHHLESIPGLTNSGSTCRESMKGTELV